MRRTMTVAVPAVSVDHEPGYIEFIGIDGDAAPEGAPALADGAAALALAAAALS
jgi:hypothetical protein